MKEYTGNSTLKKVICNGCGRTLTVEDGILKEDIFEGKKIFGFFSKKDGMTEQFDLCEDCYERLTAGFVVPAEENERIELL